MIFGKHSGKGKDMGYTLKTAQYVNDFQCIGGKCTMDCCGHWDILWTNREVEKLKTSVHSDSLEVLIENSFIKRDENTNLIKLCDDGDCPFHDKEDRLCKIQKEIGAEYLSMVCRNYPICGTINNNVLAKFRSLSCPAVFDLIIANEHSCDVFVYAKSYSEDDEMIFSIDTVNDVENNTSVRYRNQLFDFFYDIISNRKRDIYTSLIIGTLAAQTLSKLEHTSPERIPEGIASISKQINSPALIKSLSDIEPNYYVKLGVVQCMLDGTAVGDKLSEILSSIRKKNIEGKFSVEIQTYITNLEKFYKICSTKPFMIRNIVRCLYMCELMPFSDNNYNIFDNYAYFCASVALIDFFGAAAATGSDNPNEIFERFKTAVCLASHPLCHNSDRVKMIIDYLKDIDCYSAGHLALIVK